MRLRGLIFLVIFSFFAVSAKAFTLKSTISDFHNFYSVKNAESLMSALQIAYILANTKADEEIYKYYKKHDIEFASRFNFLGEKKIMIPSYFVMSFFPSKEVRAFGRRSLRAIAVGVPLLTVVQHISGADRPSSGRGSVWRFFVSSHGASGHAFMGAVPFLTAERMTKNTYLKSIFFSLSFFTGLARLNLNKHYPSQVLLGWFIAYRSVSCVFDTDKRVKLTPMLSDNADGIGLEVKF